MNLLLKEFTEAIKKKEKVKAQNLYGNILTVLSKFDHNQIALNIGNIQEFLQNTHQFIHLFENDLSEISRLYAELLCQVYKFLERAPDFNDLKNLQIGLHYQIGKNYLRLFNFEEALPHLVIGLDLLKCEEVLPFIEYPTQKKKFLYMIDVSIRLARFQIIQQINKSPENTSYIVDFFLDNATTVKNATSLIKAELASLRLFFLLAGLSDIYEKLYSTLNINSKDEELKAELLTERQRYIELSKTITEDRIDEKIIIHEINKYFSQKPFWLKKRERLQELKNELLENKISSSGYSDKFKKIITAIIKKQVDYLPGGDEFKFSFLGLGSYGRGDFAPRSDLDIALLIANLKDGYFKYIEAFTTLINVHLKLLSPCCLEINDRWKVEFVHIGPQIDRSYLPHLYPPESFSTETLSESQFSLKKFIFRSRDKVGSLKSRVFLTNQPEKLAKWVCETLYNWVMNKAKEADIGFAFALLFPQVIYSNDDELFSQYQKTLINEFREASLKNANFIVDLVSLLLNRWQNNYSRIKYYQNCIDLKEVYLTPLVNWCLTVGFLGSLQQTDNVFTYKIDELLDNLKDKKFLSEFFALELKRAWEFLRDLRIKVQLSAYGTKDIVKSPLRMLFTLFFLSNPRFESTEFYLPLVNQLLTTLSDHEHRALSFLQYFLLIPLFEFNDLVKLRWLWQSRALNFESLDWYQRDLLANSIHKQLTALLKTEDLKGKLEDLAHYLIATDATVNDHERYFSILPEQIRFAYFQILEKTLLEMQHVAANTILQRLAWIPNQDGMRIIVLKRREEWANTLLHITGDQATTDDDFPLGQVSWVTVEGKTIKRWLKPSYAKQLFDGEGERLPREETLDGRGWVRSLKDLQGNVLAYAKWAELPGMQMAAERLIDRVSGLSTVSTLVKFEIESMKKMYPLMLSKPAGQTLRNIRREKMHLKDMESQLNPYFFGLKVFDTLIVRAGDDKDDNLAIQTINSADSDLENVALFSFDVEQSFVHPLISKNREKQDRLELKSLALAFKAMQKKPDERNKRARQQTRSLDPDKVVEAWLKELEILNQAWVGNLKENIQGMFANYQLKSLGDTNRKQDFCYIPIVFIPGTVARVYEDLRRLQTALDKETEEENYFALLRCMEPKLGHHYEAIVLDNLAEDPQLRFDKLPMEFIINYEEIKEEETNGIARSQSLGAISKPALSTQKIEVRHSVHKAKPQVKQTLTLIQKNYRHLKTAIKDNYVFHLSYIYKQEFEQYKTHYHQIQNILEGIKQGKFTESFNQITKIPIEENWLKEKIIENIDWKRLCQQEKNKKLVESFLNNVAGIAFRRLILTDCDFLTDSLLIGLLQNSPELHTLDLRGCTQITEKSLGRLEDLCSSLEQLYLSRQKSLTYLCWYSWYSLFTSPDNILELPYLRVLEVEHCRLLSFVNLDCPHLMKLTVTSCLKLLDVEIGAAKLSGLHIENCPKLEFIAFERLLKSSNHFNYLHIAKCTFIPLKLLAYYVARDNHWHEAHCRELLRLGALIEYDISFGRTLRLAELPFTETSWQSLLEILANNKYSPIDSIDLRGAKIPLDSYKQILMKIEQLGNLQLITHSDYRKPPICTRFLRVDSKRILDLKVFPHEKVKLYSHKKDDERMELYPLRENEELDVVIWDINTGDYVRKLEKYSDHPLSNLIAPSGIPREVIWEKRLADIYEVAQCVSLSGDLIATLESVDNDGTILLWEEIGEVKGRQRKFLNSIKAYPGEISIVDLAATADGRLVARSEFGALQVWAFPGVALDLKIYTWWHRVWSQKFHLAKGPNWLLLHFPNAIAIDIEIPQLTDDLILIKEGLLFLFKAALLESESFNYILVNEGCFILNENQQLLDKAFSLLVALHPQQAPASPLFKIQKLSLPSDPNLWCQLSSLLPYFPYLKELELPTHAVLGQEIGQKMNFLELCYVHSSLEKIVLSEYGETLSFTCPYTILTLTAVFENKLIVGFKSNTFQLINLQKMEQSEIISLDYQSSIISLTMLPDGRLAAGCKNGAILLWNIETREFDTLRLRRSDYWRAGSITALTVLDGRLVSGSSNGVIRLWDIETPWYIGRGRYLEILTSNKVICALTAIDNQRLAVACSNGEILLLDTKPQAYQKFYKYNQDHSIALRMVGDNLISISSEGVLQAWNLDTSQCKESFLFAKKTAWARNACILNDGRLAIVPTDNQIQTWHPSASQKLLSLKTLRALKSKWSYANNLHGVKLSWQGPEPLDEQVRQQWEVECQAWTDTLFENLDLELHWQEDTQSWFIKSWNSIAPFPYQYSTTPFTNPAQYERTLSFCLQIMLFLISTPGLKFDPSFGFSHNKTRLFISFVVQEVITDLPASQNQNLNQPLPTQLTATSSSYSQIASQLGATNLEEELSIPKKEKNKTQSPQISETEVSDNGDVQQTVSSNPTAVDIPHKAPLALSRKGLSAKGKLSQQQLIQALPQDKTWGFGTAVDNGDCFYDAIAQSLYARAMDRTHTIKSLRKMCSDYIHQLNTQFPQANWVKIAIEKDNGADDYQAHLATVRYSQEEMARLKQEDNVFTGYAIWGKPHIEGKILAQQLNISLHIVEFHEASGMEAMQSMPPIHTLVTKDKVSQVEEKSIHYQDEQIIHLAVYRNHFVPILPSHNLKQQQSNPESRKLELTQFSKHSPDDTQNSTQLNDDQDDDRYEFGRLDHRKF